MTSAKCHLDFINDARNGVALRGNSIRNAPIFGIDEVDDFRWRRQIDIDGARIATFSDARIERRSGHG